MWAMGGVFNLIAALVLAFPAAPASQPPAQDYGSTHSPHGNLNVPCQNCHTTQGWKPIRAIPEFDHNQTRYPLRGMHQSVTCTQCHIKPVFTNVGQRCQDCHADIHKRQLGANCEQCHTVRGWNVSIQQVQQHNKRFPLTGAHAAVDCDSCHKGAANSKFQTMSTDCYSCHAADFKNATNPNHVTAQFGTTCDQCHGTDNWLNAKFDHSSVGFPLSGGHAVPPRQCADCHTNNNYNLTSTTCITCHQNDFNNATNPVPHKGFSTTCQTCHDTIAWTDATFDHGITGFTLTGMHTVPPRQCTDCHNAKFGGYNISSTACVTCHLSDFQGATNPNHVAGGFAQTCEICHSTSAWQPATFDHSKSAFPLTGSHMVPPRTCADCHGTNNYNITVTTCISCHQKDFTGATSPVPHTGFPTTCEQCHDTVQWTDGKFDHSTTGFTLTGSHTDPPRQCIDCHVNNNYTLNSTLCITCHQKDFNGATSPVPHTGFPTTCELCHDTVQWTDATFNHNSTPFPLTGSHTVPPRACVDCHVNNNYTTLPTTCVGCHLNDYNKALSPVNHISANFPTTCESCHDTVQWTDGVFNHTSTGFALTGLHTVPPRLCTDCHVNNNYTLNSTACVTCHLKDYQNTTNPNHAAAGFPQQCELCHDTTTWTDSTFNHNNTTFPLTGSHTVPPRQCTDCHVNNNYTTLPIICIGCHQTDYNNTTNPGHSAQPQFFPTTCQNCHSTTNWLNATFNHTQYTQFPTSHGGANNVCATCHINSNNYAIFQCTGCHGGNNPNNFHHDNVSGYVYNSINCYQCHQNGQGGG
jgi:hypothetical protein